MRIRAVVKDDLDDLARLRAAFWPSLSLNKHRAEIKTLLEHPTRFAAFLAATDKGEAIGFAEVSKRQDYVNGCATSPVAFLEGVFVLEAWRSQGIARQLVKSVVEWATRQGFDELASDADTSNQASHLMHEALGFEETERVVFFRRLLK